MIDEKHLKLINQEINGENSNFQSKKLKKYLDLNPEANRYYQELSLISQALSKTKFIEPPANLKKNIINQIPFDKYIGSEKRNILIDQIKNLFIERKPRYIYVLIACFLCVATILLLFTLFINKKTLNVNDVYGTFKINVGNYHVAEKIDIDVDKINGQANLLLADSTILLDLNIQTENEVTIRINYKGNDLNLLEFDKSITLDNLTKEPNSLQFKNYGMNHYVIKFGRKNSSSSQINLKILISAQIIYEHTFQNTGDNSINLKNNQ